MSNDTPTPTPDQSITPSAEVASPPPAEKRKVTQILSSALPEQHPQMISFVILALVTLGLVILFLMIVMPFILSLLAAAMAALVTYPAYLKLSERLGGWRYVSAALFTLLLVLLVVLPVLIGATAGISQFQRGVAFLQQEVSEEAPRFHEIVKKIDDRLDISHDELKMRAKQFGESLLGPAVKWGQGVIGSMLDAIIKFGIILIAYFFFLVDGARIIRTWEETTPIDVAHDRVIRQEFANVCRAAIWGTVMAAIGQAIVMTIGLFFINLFTDAHLGGWLFLLGGLTAVAALVPFLGASLVWLPTSITLFFNDHFVAGAAGLFLGLVIVSSIDNLIRIMVLKGSAELHPLLVLICVFGGIQFAGVLGIFIGPAIGAIVFALLKVLRQEISALEGSASTPVTT